MKVLFKFSIIETSVVNFNWDKNTVAIHASTGEFLLITTSPDNLKKIYDSFESSSVIDLRSYDYIVKGKTFKELLKDIKVDVGYISTFVN